MTTFRSLAFAAAALLAGCSRDAGSATAMAEGRTYTDWLIARQFDKLWSRFSPEMRNTFTSGAALADFAGHTVEQLGPPHGVGDERVTSEDTVRVYTRTVAFARAPGRVRVQWTLSRAGTVTGFFLRPDTAPHR